MGAGERVQAPPRAVARAVRGRQSQEPGQKARWQQVQRLEPGCWSSVCGVSHYPHLWKALSPLPRSPQNFPASCHCSSSSLAHPVLVLSAPSPSAPPPWCCLSGTVVGGQNLTAPIGKPLVLNCKGAPRKPPQQLEWKLVSEAPAAASPSPYLRSPFPKGLHCLGPSPLSPEHRPDRSVEGPVSPGRPLGQRGSSPPQRLPPPTGRGDPG